MTLFIIFQYLDLNHSQLENKMNNDSINMIFVISMVDLVGIDVHMSYIHNSKFITLEPPSGYKRNYILMKFHTSVYLEVLNKNFLKSFGGAVGKFPMDR